MVDLNTVDYIESYQGVVYGTATGGKYMILAVARVRGRDQVKVIFPDIKGYLTCDNASDKLSPKEWQDIKRYILVMGAAPK